jgi:hypothetical protein
VHQNYEIDVDDPQLGRRHRSWVSVLTAFHHFIWQNISEQLTDTAIPMVMRATTDDQTE